MFKKDAYSEIRNLPEISISFLSHICVHVHASWDRRAIFLFFKLSFIIQMQAITRWRCFVRTATSVEAWCLQQSTDVQNPVCCPWQLLQQPYCNNSIRYIYVKFWYTLPALNLYADIVLSFKVLPLKGNFALWGHGLFSWGNLDTLHCLHHCCNIKQVFPKLWQSTNLSSVISLRYIKRLINPNITYSLRVAEHWNSLPTNFKYAPELNSFKTQTIFKKFYEEMWHTGKW